MSSMELSKEDIIMNEKVYKTMNVTGGTNIALGIVMIVAGLSLGILTIVNGARLLRNKSGIMF